MEPPIGTSYTHKSPPAASKLPLSQQNLQQKQRTEAKATAIAQRRQIILPSDRCSSHDRKFWESRAQFGARHQQQHGDGENDGSSIFFSTRLERRNARHTNQQLVADGVQQKPEFLHNEIEDNFWEDLAISRGNMLRRVSCAVDTGMQGNGAAGGQANREEGMLREVVRKLRESVGTTARRTAYGFRLPSRDQKAAAAVPKASRARSAASGPIVDKDGQNNGDGLSTNQVEAKCREDAEEQHGIWPKLAAEFCGDLFLVFIGSLSALGSNDTTARLHAGLATGLTIFVLVASIGQISGGHFNPAVSWAMALSGKMPFHQMLAFWAAQLCGGIVGAVLVWAVTQTSQYAEIGGGAQFLKAQQQRTHALVVEALLTALLVQTVLNSAAETPNNPLAPLAIGCTILVDILAGGPISGASMNPARSFGPCLVAFWLLPMPSAGAGVANSSSVISSVDIRAQIWPSHFIFWAGPLIGASVSAMAYRHLFTRQRFCKI